eukprot:TRINITY_DN111717_c0_g1_i1.p1 TRINITY_DN111717_c0_g1~~TRINITY_DN111717_c0_g1_i1.p1  ORF type:complete len:732 (+),score=68.13 TRINITY_DN111717_c0_g1_i1:23-2197(+)
MAEKPVIKWPPWPWPPPADSLPSRLRVSPGGSNGHPGPFPNHDCVGLESPLVDWDSLREGFQTECSHSRLTRNLRCAARVVDWEQHVYPFLRMQRPEGGHRFPQPAGAWSLADGWERYKDDFDGFDRIEADAYSECPLGVLVLNIVRTLFCVHARHVNCYLRHTMRVSRELYKTDLSIIMGTDWPVYALLNSIDWSWPGIPGNRDYDCERSARETVEWPRFLRSFQVDPSRPGASFWSDSLRYIFAGQLAANLYTASHQCLYGVYAMNLGKTLWAADTESSSYTIYAPYTQWVLYESLHLLGATSWPIFALYHHFKSVRRHGFQLDYSARELGGLPFRDHSIWLQEQPIDYHLTALEMFDSWRPAFAAAVRAIRSALSNAPAAAGEPGPRFIYVTMVYGRMNKYISGWAERLRHVGVQNLVMATLDEEAFNLCSQHHGPQCVKGTVSVFNKYTLLLIALQLGIDVCWLDFDIFLVRNPSFALATAVEPPGAGIRYDILMGYDYDSDCLCNGFFYLRARPSTHRWLFELVRWMFDHPYEHDQRAIGAFLNYTEKISAKPHELPPVPRWHVFDVENDFVNWGSWEGRTYERLMLLHFVDGSAFSLYGRDAKDPSVPDAKRRQLASEASQAEAQQPKTEEFSAMDAFYRPEVVAAAADDIWRIAPELKRRLDSQRRSKPFKKQACGILPDVASSHDGYGWITMPEVEPPSSSWAVDVTVQASKFGEK